MESYSFQFAEAAKTLTHLELIKLSSGSPSSTPGPVALICFALSSTFKIIFSRRKVSFIHGGDLAIWPLIWLASIRHPKAHISLAAHGTDIAYCFRRSWRARLYRAYISLGRWLLRKSTLIANSAATASLLKEKKFQNIVTVKLAVRPEGEPPLLNAKPKDYLAYTGRMTKAKGIEWFVENVLGKLPERIELWIAGPEDFSKDLPERLASRIKFMGVLSGGELVHFRQNAIAVIHPNLDYGIESFEGFGLSVSESVAANAIVLASSHYGLNDAMSQGVTGFFLPPGHSEEWQRKIEEITGWSQNQRSQFLEKSRQSTLTLPGWEDIVSETLNAASGSTFSSDPT